MTYFIAVANQKGGVAKTTTTVSLGAALVQAGREVLVVDLDAQANLTLALGVNPASVRQSIATVLFNLNTLVRVSRETPIPGLDLVPSNSEMELAERFLPIRKNYQSILKTATNSWLRYDYVLFDCPPSLGAVTTNALMAANLLIIPTQPEYYSVSALKSILGFVQKQPGLHLSYRILITMFDQRNRIHQYFSDHLRNLYGKSVLESAIGIDTKLRESAVVGIPITHYLPKSRSALQYQALAEELLQDVQETVASLA